MSKLRLNSIEGLTRFEPPVFEDRTRLSKRLDEIEREAYEKGFATGHKAGLEMADKEVKLILGRLEELVTQIIAQKEELLQNMKYQIVELVFLIARKIVMNELQTNPQLVVAMTEEALKRIERQSRITIKINPLLKEMFEKYIPGLTKMHQEIILETDPSIPPYGSIVINPEQEVITEIDEQLKTLLMEISQRI